MPNPQEVILPPDRDPTPQELISMLGPVFAQVKDIDSKVVGSGNTLTQRAHLVQQAIEKTSQELAGRGGPPPPLPSPSLPPAPQITSVGPQVVEILSKVKENQDDPNQLMFSFTQTTIDDIYNKLDDILKKIDKLTALIQK